MIIGLLFSKFQEWFMMPRSEYKQNIINTFGGMARNEGLVEVVVRVATLVLVTVKIVWLSL